MDFGELKNDKDFVEKATNLQNALDKIEERITAVCDFPNYDDLSTEEKVKYDLFLSYSINSLYWMLCKLQAIEPGMVCIGLLMSITLESETLIPPLHFLLTESDKKRNIESARGDDA